MRVFACLLFSCVAGLAQASEEAMQRFTQLNADPALRQQALA